MQKFTGGDKKGGKNPINFLDPLKNMCNQLHVMI